MSERIALIHELNVLPIDAPIHMWGMVGAIIEVAPMPVLFAKAGESTGDVWCEDHPSFLPFHPTSSGCGDFLNKGGLHSICRKDRASGSNLMELFS